MLGTIAEFINSSILFGTVIMLGALGEILTEKSGHLNLGIPGIVYLGGFGGWLGGFIFEKNVYNGSGVLLIAVSLISAMIFALLGGLLYSFITVTLKCNQNVTGLALTYLSVGICSFGGQYILNALKASGSGKAIYTSKAFKWCLNVEYKMQRLDDISAFFGKAFLGYGVMVFVAIIIAVAMHFIFKKTNVGLSLRSVGESSSTADAQGINTTKYKYLAICIGAIIAGLGGATYVLDYSTGVWSTANSIESLGWLSVALVIFATWKPINAIWGSYLFAFFYWIYQFAPKLLGIKLDTQATYAMQMLPYLISILVLIFISLRKKKEDQPPAALGLSYFREDR